MIARTALILLLLTSIMVYADAASPAIGTWEGESICTVPNSPCHDEHVVYEIKADGKTANALTIDAFKIVKGEKLFMGALNCTWKAAESIVSCHYRADDDWAFKLAGSKMQGELHVGQDHQLYRKISVTKK